jgi:hypothetical protein
MPGSDVKIIAMPTASDTAPPVRPTTTLADLFFDEAQVVLHRLFAFERQLLVGGRLAR